MQREGRKQPVVIEAEGTLPRRMREAFASEWKRVTGSAPAVIVLANEKDAVWKLKDSVAAPEQLVQRDDALVELVRNSFLLETEARDDVARHFERLSAVVEQTPCHALRYPRRYADLPAVTLAILEHARR